MRHALQVALGGGELSPPVVTVTVFWTLCVLYYALVDTCPFALMVTRAALPDAWWGAWAYALMHVNKIHLWGCLMSWVVYGAWFELVHGSTALVAVLAVAAPLGSFVHVLSNDGPLIGLGPVVFGLMAAPIVAIAINWRELPYPLMRLAAYLPLAAMIAWGQITAPPEVTVAANMAGALGGFLVACVVSRNAVLERWEAWVAVAAAVAVVGLGVAAPIADRALWIYLPALVLPGLALLARSAMHLAALGNRLHIVQPGDEMSRAL